jgi:hypothetical protein
METAARPYKKEFREITIKTTDGAVVQGKINIGVKERMSDLFTKSDSPFIILTDARHREGLGKVLFVNKAHVVWAEPQEE